MNNFRTYHVATEFYRQTRSLKLARHLREQLDRAASSIVLNLAEGAGRAVGKDQKRFFQIAFGSLRECQAILDIAQVADLKLIDTADKLAAHLYLLIKH